MSPTLFFNEELRGIALAIEGHNQALERDYHLNFLACYNAFGAFNDGKNFKIEHPFKTEEKQSKKPTKEERDLTLAFLQEHIKGGEK